MKDEIPFSIAAERFEFELRGFIQVKIAELWADHEMAVARIHVRLLNTDTMRGRTAPLVGDVEVDYTAPRHPTAIRR